MPTQSPRKIESKECLVTALRPDPKNARRHSEAQIAAVAQSIERFGMVTPIVVQPSGQIIGGHATWEACKRLGHDKVSCSVVHGLSAAQYQALGVALNRLPETSSWDNATLADVLASIDAAGEDVLGLGFSEKELHALQDDGAALDVVELKTTPVDDEFWISIRGPLRHQADALKAMQAAMKPFGDVTVELGTVPIEDL